MAPVCVVEYHPHPIIYFEVWALLLRRSISIMLQKSDGQFSISLKLSLYIMICHSAVSNFIQNYRNIEFVMLLRN